MVTSLVIVSGILMHMCSISVTAGG